MAYILAQQGELNCDLIIASAHSSYDDYQVTDNHADSSNPNPTKSNPAVRPIFLGDKSGDVRQRALTDWNTFGDTPSTSAGGASSDPPLTIPSRTGAAALQRHIIPDEDPNRELEMDEEDELLGQGEGLEDDGGPDDDEIQEDGDNVDSLCNSRTRQKLPSIVYEAYQNHLDYLKRTKDIHSKPRIYVEGTFWLPRKSNFFLLHGSSKPRPSQFYTPPFFLWDPEHLIQGSLLCPKCHSSLERLQVTRPRRVVDLEDCYYMIGQRHRCLKCKHPRSGKHTVTYNSWDPRIRDMLPHEPQAEFPAILSHRSAISADVFALMRSCFNYGVGSKQFSHILLGLHHRRFSHIHVQYLDGILSRSNRTDLNDGPQPTFEAFSKFADPEGYAGFVPSSSWLCMMYDSFVEKHGTEIDQKTAMLSADIIAIDHSHKVIFAPTLFRLV